MESVKRRIVATQLPILSLVRKVTARASRINLIRWDKIMGTLGITADIRTVETRISARTTTRTT